MIIMYVRSRLNKRRRNNDPAGSEQRSRFWQVRQGDSPHLNEAPGMAGQMASAERNDAQIGNGKEVMDDEKAFDDLSELAQAIEGIVVSEKEGLASKQFIKKVANEIQRFPQLNKAPYKIAIANLVCRRAKTVYNLSITTEEVDALWD